MVSEDIAFGWLPEDRTYATSEYDVLLADTHDEAVRFVSESGQVDSAGWYHPPVLVGPPRRPVSVFQIPATHIMRITDDAEGEYRLSSLLIMVFGLLKGLRLVPSAWAHFYRVPTRPHQLTDFYVKEEAITRVLDLALVFWRINTSELRRLIFGAFHWHSFGRTYMQPFEVFSAQYTVLDTAWRIYRLKTAVKSVTHARRVEVLAAAYGIPLPEWAVVSNGASYLSALRNSLLHEGMWANEPIGFSHPKLYANIYREIHALNSRVLLALLGDQSRYVTSKIDRNMKLLR